MKKIAKITTFCMAMAMSAATVISAAGCASSEALINDGKTINVKINSAGYGTDYIYALKEKFEAAYAEEGYKLNIFTPKAGLTNEIVLQDIATGAGADLYISTGITEDLMNKDAYKGTIADITELVANQKPINFKGEEEGDKTIAQILSENDYGYRGVQKSDGSYYAVPWTAGSRGLAVNTAVLADYNLEIPKTSKEFFHCYDVIMEKAGSTGIFPITQISSSNNYPVSFTSGWMAQYEGYDWYKQYVTFEDKDGTALSKDTAVEMFNAEGIRVMFENMFHALDPNCSTYGSKTQSLEDAQAKFMKGKCAFMMNGDWLLQETYSSYTDEQRKDITFVQVPMISELGVKLFGEGTKYNKSEADCEKILRAIVDGADENKEVAAIKAEVDSKCSVNIDEADVQRVAEARGYTYVESVDSGMYINASSEIKDIVALFIRMCCSNEGGQLIASKVYSCNPFAQSYETSQYGFVNASRALQSNRYFKGVRPDISGHRATLDPNFTSIFPYTGTYVNIKIIALNKTMYDAETLVKEGTAKVYVDAAAEMQKNIYNDAKNNYKW